MEKEWETFLAMIFKGQNLSEIQIKEMRKSFYAGAFVVICSMKQINDTVSEDEAINYFESIYKECLVFYNQLMQGKS